MLVQAKVEGKVQGVFFRRTVKELADSMQIQGSVRNLSDGSVEIIVQADPETIDRFFEKLSENPGSATISKIERKEMVEKRAFQSFEICY